MSLTITLQLISCGTGYSQKEINDFNQVLAENLKVCEEEKLSGYIKTNMQYAECQNRIISNSYIELDYPYMDLVDLLNAYRLYLAENLDNGNITYAQSRLMYEEYRQKVATEESRRFNYEREKKRRAWKEFGESLDEVEVQF